MDWVEIFNNLVDEEEDEDVGDDVVLTGRNGLAANPGGSSLSRKAHQEEEEDLDNCDTREEGMNVNDDDCPGMEEWFVKTTLC